MTDLELVAAMASGEQDALREFNRRYGNAIAAVALRILANNADAEEVAADVLWQAWRDASHFDRRRGSVGAWLMTLARSRAIDRLRARQVRDRAAQDMPLTLAGDEPSRDMVADRRRRIAQVMKELKDGEREVLELAYFSDLSQSEIAAQTRLPLGTVKSRMRSAMIKLRDALGASSYL